MDRGIEIGDDPLQQGLDLFNKGHFFEAHDVWEDLWTGTRGPDRKFLQGLIHAAVGCYHLNHKNFRGAHSQFDLSRAALRPSGPTHLGIDVARTLEFLDEFLIRLRDLEAPDLHGIQRPRIFQAR